MSNDTATGAPTVEQPPNQLPPPPATDVVSEKPVKRRGKKEKAEAAPFTGCGTYLYTVDITGQAPFTTYDEAEARDHYTHADEILTGARAIGIAADGSKVRLFKQELSTPLDVD